MICTWIVELLPLEHVFRGREGKCDLAVFEHNVARVEVRQRVLWAEELDWYGAHYSGLSARVMVCG